MWDGFIETFDIYEPCNFYMKYTKDITYNNEYENRKKKINHLINYSPWLKNTIGHYEYCLGGCGKTYDKNYCLRYHYKAINLCFNCFLDDDIRKSLKEKYPVKCLVL